MTDIRFTPSVWQEAGRRYEEAGADLVSGVVHHLSVLDVSQIGCDKGSHLVDQALSLVIPAVKEAFDAACRDLADNMTGIGEAMGDTGTAYQQLEETQAELARQISQGPSPWR
jgi:hypothetical protein